MKTSITFSEQTWTFSELFESNLKANTIVSILSVLGCIFNIVTTIIFKISKTGLGKMVIALSIMDLIFSSSFLFLELIVENELICQVGSFLWVFGFVGSLSWSCCFAHCLYRTVKSGDSQTQSEFIGWYRTVSIIFSSIIAITAVCMKFWVLEVEAQRCVFATAASHFDLPCLIIFLIPALLSSIFCCVGYMGVVKELYRDRSELYLELLIYPLILIICDIPTEFHCLYIKITGERPADASTYICQILLRSQGFLNALAFGLSKRIVQQYRELCRRKGYKGKSSDKLKDSLMYSQNKLKDTTTSLPEFVKLNL